MLTYLECLQSCTFNPELVAEFNRLSGYQLGESARRSPSQVLIDEATEFDAVVQERERVAFRQFSLFVKDVVWDRLPVAERQEPCWVPEGEFEVAATS